jgi:hypothetical protein
MTDGLLLDPRDQVVGTPRTRAIERRIPPAPAEMILTTLAEGRFGESRTDARLGT